MKLEQLRPDKIYENFQEWTAKRRARSEFDLWARNHPTELKILDLLETESQHKTDPDNPRRIRLLEITQQVRRELGLRDDLVAYTMEHPFLLEEALVHNEVTLSEEEKTLLKEVNHGFWARAGYFTKGVRRLVKLR